MWFSTLFLAFPKKTPDSEVPVKTLALLATGCAVLFLIPLSVSGQTSLGFQGGLSLATLGGSDVGDMDPGYKTGFGLGAFLELPVSDVLSIQPELLYLQKGAEGSEQGVNITVAISYVELPVLLRINVPVEGNVAPYFVVGPAISFKAGCEVTGEGGGVEVKIDCDEAEAETKSVDFGGVVGAGLSFGAGPGNIHVGARFNYGLTTVDDSEYDEDVNNQAFSLLAGYSFPIGG